MDIDELTDLIKSANTAFFEARREISKVIVGQSEMIHRLFIGLLTEGHILIEGLPGLAKTLSVLSLAKVTQCDFKRIQFTPDLLPADLIGTSIYNPKDATFSVSKGPVFTNILLADEINRAPAKVQSALLEVMQEKQVTISGQTFATGKPFMVLATQNPIEHEGTYALPEAQTDRFLMKVKVGYPQEDEEKEVIQRMVTAQKPPEVTPKLSVDAIMSAKQLVQQVYVDEKIIDYIISIIHSTRDPEKYGIKAKHLIMYGASPRASLGLTAAAKALAFLQGRAFVTPHDIKQLAPDILRHRIRRTYEAEAEEISPDILIEMILNQIPVP